MLGTVTTKDKKGGKPCVKSNPLEMNVSKSPSPLFIAPKGALENRDAVECGEQ